MVAKIIRALHLRYFYSFGADEGVKFLNGILFHMEYFSVIKDADIFDGPTSTPKEWIIRKTSKGFVYDEQGNVCLLEVKNYYGLPGGGIEGNETFEQAFIRECKEEIGCDIEIDTSIGVCNQYRSRLGTIYTIQYFVAHVVGKKGVPTTTEEDEKTVSFSWYSEEEVSKNFREQISHIPQEDYPMQFNARTHSRAWELCLESKA